MPWTAEDAQRHTKKAKGKKAKKWAAIANAVLKRTGDEGQAVRIANAHMNSHSERLYGK